MNWFFLLARDGRVFLQLRYVFWNAKIEILFYFVVRLFIYK